jgi:hypothetical protein
MGRRRLGKIGYLLALAPSDGPEKSRERTLVHGLVHLISLELYTTPS